MATIILRSDEVRSLREHGRARVVRACPHGRVRWNPVVLGGHGGWADSHGRPLRCPFGAPGDRLAVRETWMPMTEGGDPVGVAIYRATDRPEPDGDAPLRWRSPATMPRWAFRMTVKTVSVDVKRAGEEWAWAAEVKAVME